MLAIRMQRTGRKGYAQFRIIVQEARRTPTSGAIVAQIGHYNPHAKEITIDKEKASFYLNHGAQPSESIARLLQKEGVKMPVWVKLAADKARPIRHGDKLRKNRPAEPKTPVAETVEAPAEPQAASTDAVEGETPPVEIEPPKVETTTPEITEPATTESSADSEEEAAIEAEPPAEAPEIAQKTEAKVEPEASENTKTSDKPAK